MAGGSLAQFARLLCNVFEAPACEKHRAISKIHEVYTDSGALGAVMSGTGPTVAGLFADEKAAQAARGRLLPLYKDTFVCEAVSEFGSP